MNFLIWKHFVNFKFKDQKIMLVHHYIKKYDTLSNKIIIKLAFAKKKKISSKLVNKPHHRSSTSLSFMCVKRRKLAPQCATRSLDFNEKNEMATRSAVCRSSSPFSVLTVSFFSLYIQEFAYTCIIWYISYIQHLLWAYTSSNDGEIATSSYLWSLKIRVG